MRPKKEVVLSPSVPEGTELKASSRPRHLAFKVEGGRRPQGCGGGRVQPPLLERPSGSPYSWSFF